MFAAGITVTGLASRATLAGMDDASADRLDRLEARLDALESLLEKLVGQALGISPAVDDDDGWQALTSVASRVIGRSLCNRMMLDD
jgi:hypothetical protein